MTTATSSRQKSSRPSSAEIKAACDLTGVRAPKVPEALALEAVETARLLRDLDATNARAAEIANVLLPAAQVEHRDRFAAALASGQTDEPEPVAIIELQTEYAACERRADALRVAHEEARQLLIRTLDEARPGWLPTIEEDLAEAADAYRALVRQLREAHPRLADAIAAARWLRDPESNPPGIVMLGWVPVDGFVVRPGEPFTTSQLYDLLDTTVDGWAK